MNSLIEEVLKFLEDGRWHDFFEIVENFLKLGFVEKDVKKIVDFLSEFGFVDVDDQSKRVKMCDHMYNLISSGE